MHEYIHHKIHLSRHQAVKLLAGHRIRLHRDHLEGQHDIWLTKTQANKHAASKAKHKGHFLQFSPHQIEHHLLHGTGFWSSLKSGASSLLSNVVAPIASNVASNLANQAVSRGTSAINNKVNSFVNSKLGPQQGSGFLDDLGNFAQSIAVPVLTGVAQHALSGHGVHKRRGRPRKQHGDGLFA